MAIVSAFLSETNLSRFALECALRWSRRTRAAHRWAGGVARPARFAGIGATVYAGSVAITAASRGRARALICMPIGALPGSRRCGSKAFTSRFATMAFASLVEFVFFSQSWRRARSRWSSTCALRASTSPTSGPFSCSAVFGSRRSLSGAPAERVRPAARRAACDVRRRRRRSASTSSRPSSRCSRLGRHVGLAGAFLVMQYKTLGSGPRTVSQCSPVCPSCSPS